MKTVVFRGLRYLVMPEISKGAPCSGCSMNIPNNPCVLREEEIKHLESEIKCGMEAIIYVERTREAVKQYRVDRLVERLEDA